MTWQITIKDKTEDADLIKIAPFRKKSKKTEPHKHNNYFEIIFLSKGGGFHTIDNEKYAVDPPVIFFVRKEQVHFWELTSDPDGFVLILKRAFFDLSLDKELKNLISKISDVSCLQLKRYENIERYFMLLNTEYLCDNQYKKTIIEGLLKALLAKIASIPKSLPIPFKSKSGTYNAFRELLNDTDPLKNNVAYYAEKLNTTPQNLNNVCQNATGLSARKVISEYIISEAKRLLIYTSLSVSEIAFNLNFNDPSHFVKYFKRYAGITPLTFRNALH